MGLMFCLKVRQLSEIIPLLQVFVKGDSVELLMVMGRPYHETTGC